MGFGFLFGENQRDVSLNMNITKIGAETFDRFLQLVDPEGKDDKIQDTRGKLGFIDIEEVAVWIRYENLNVDLRSTSLFRIPFTRIGIPNVARDVVRGHALGESIFDQKVQPMVDAKLGPILGWAHVN
jgi:hypothetical protein